MSIAPKTPAPAEAAPASPAAAPEEPEKGAKKEKPGAKGKEPKAKGGKGDAAGKGPTKKAAKVIPDNPNFRYIVRLAGADLDGTRAAGLALTGVRGVGLRLSEVALRIAQVNPREMLGNLPEATVEGIEVLLTDLPSKVPPWMVNHPIDYATGEIHHLVGPDLETARRDDVNQMKMIRSYRGVRHERGQKVRGQRTRSNGRTGMAAGVLKKDAKAAAAAAGKGEKGGGGAAPAAPAAAAAPAATDKKAAAPTGDKKAGAPAGDKKSTPEKKA